jgi:hypothetical protein
VGYGRPVEGLGVEWRELQRRLIAARNYAGHSQTVMGQLLGGLDKRKIIEYEQGAIPEDFEVQTIIAGYSARTLVPLSWFTADWTQLEVGELPESDLEALNERLDGIERQIGERVDHEQFVHAVDLLQKAIESLDQQLTRGRKAA